MCKSYDLGNKKFYMKSSLAFNAREFRCFITFLLLIIPSNVFIGLEYDKDFEFPYNFLFIFGTLGLELISIYLFLRCTFIDPGVVLIPIQNIESDSEINLKIIECKNKTFVLKYCAACKLFRPLRAHHCRLCNLCIEELDHHCPWISNCVGRRNRKLFVELLIFSFLLIFEILSLSIYKFIIGLRNPEESQTRLSYLIAFIFLSSTFGLSVFSLFVLQLFLIFKGLTTNEYLRGTFNNIDNPFNDGCFSNLCSFLKNESGITNISFDYLVEKEKYDNEMALTSQDENRKNSEFSLEMSRIKSNETLKIDSEEEMKNSRENSSMHKKLMKEPNGI